MGRGKMLARRGGCSKTQRHTDFVKNKNQGKVEIKFVQKVTIWWNMHACTSVIGLFAPEIGLFVNSLILLSLRLSFRLRANWFNSDSPFNYWIILSTLSSCSVQFWTKKTSMKLEYICTTCTNKIQTLPPTPFFWAELRFVTTVATGSRVKFVPAV